MPIDGASPSDNKRNVNVWNWRRRCVLLRPNIDTGDCNHRTRCKWTISIGLPEKELKGPHRWKIPAGKCIRTAMNHRMAEIKHFFAGFLFLSLLRIMNFCFCLGPVACAVDRKRCDAYPMQSDRRPDRQWLSTRQSSFSSFFLIISPNPKWHS